MVENRAGDGRRRKGREGIQGGLRGGGREEREGRKRERMGRRERAMYECFAELFRGHGCVKF